MSAEQEEMAKSLKKAPRGRRKLGTEQVAENTPRRVNGVPVQINPEATLPAVINVDLGQVGMEVPKLEPYLMIPDGLPFEQWAAAADQFKPLAQHLGMGVKVIDRYSDSLQWRLGDLLAYGEQMADKGADGYADKYKQYEDGTMYGYSEETVKGVRWVAASFPAAERVAELTWSHHKVVAKLRSDVRRRLLQRAVEEGWSVNDLRAEVGHKTTERKGKETVDNGKEPEARKAPDVVPCDFSFKELNNISEHLWAAYELITDIRDQREKDPDSDIDFDELKATTRKGLAALYSIVVGIEETEDEEEELKDDNGSARTS